MAEVLVIGKDLSTRDFSFLTEFGKLAKFDSIDDMDFKKCEGASLLIVEKTESRKSLFKEFSRNMSDVPKLVVSADRSFRGFGPWLGQPLTFPVRDPDEKELLFLAGYLMSVKNLRSENTRLREDISFSRRDLGLYEAVGKVLTSETEMDNMLYVLMKSIKSAIHAASWSIFLLDEETGDLVLAQTDEKKRKPDGMRVKTGEGVIGRVLREGKPILIPEASQNPFNAKTVKHNGAKTDSLVCVPIGSKDRTVGAIEFRNKPGGRPFTGTDLALLTRIVDYAAVAIKLASLYQKMAELSVTDDLTKLFNSRYLNRTIEVEIQRSERSRTSLSLIFMDIDHFKLVNDHFGHLTGSKLLVEVGQLLLKSLRSIDIVARYGGDEFVIVLPQTSPEVAARVAERIRRAIEQNIFMKKEGCSIRITASFGVSSYPECAKSKEDLLRLADEAMYRVKNLSRNGVYAII